MTTQHSSVLRPGIVLAIVLTSYLMIVLDISIVITGLPKIRDGLGFTTVGLSWVQNAYTLFYGGFLLLAARAGDVFGRKRMFMAGLALFTLASLAIGLSPNGETLIASRAVQGIGAAILAPSVLALISIHFPEGSERTTALARYSMVAGVGSSLGLVLGGIFAEQISWRAGFFMNVPIGIVLLFAANSMLHETEKASGRFDIAGAITSTIGMGALVYGIVHSAEAGWSDTVTISSILAAVVLLAAFILNEARTAQPMLPLRLFKSRERSGAYLARMLFLGAMVGFFFFSTQLMQGVLGFTPIEAGLGFLPMTVPTLIGAMMLSKLTARFGNGGVLTLALALAAIGMLWLAQSDDQASYWASVAIPMVLVGFGNGLALGPLTVSGVAGVSQRDAGAASGLVNVAHQLGGTLGLGILVVVFASTGAAAPSGPALLAERIDASLTGGAIFLFLALGLVLALIVRPKLSILKARDPLPVCDETCIETVANNAS